MTSTGRAGMLHRILLIKLDPQYRTGLSYVRLKEAAQTVLMSAHGVQSVRVKRATDNDTQGEWDLCILIDYTSGVDEKRSAADPVRLAFEQKFLGQRAEKIWSGLFADE